MRAGDEGRAEQAELGHVVRCSAHAVEEKGHVEWVGAGRPPRGLERTGRRGRKRKEQGEARLGRQRASAGRGRKKGLG